MKKILLSKYLLTGDGTIKKDHGVVIEGNKILEVAKNSTLIEKYPAKLILDCRDKIISPGFINSHMHFYGVLSHGITPPNEIHDFESFLKDFWWPMVEDKLDAELIRKALMTSGLELINSGVTSVCDILEAPMALPGILEVEAEVIRRLGLRAILSIEASERVNKENAFLALKENIDFCLNYQNDELIAGKQCIHTTFTCSADYIKEAFKMARNIGAETQLHLSESKYEVEYCLEKYGKRPVEVYSQLGALGSDLLVSQAVKVNEAEIELLKESGVRVAHLPLSNCEVGGGVSPVPEMLNSGILVGLGTDGYINNFFEVMRGAFLIHKAHKENPAIMPAERVYKMATSIGAKAAGFENTGLIKPGYLADLITIKISTPTPVNDKNIYDQLILYHNPKNVKEVFINGRQLKENGKLLNFDINQIYEEAKEAALKLWGDK